MSDKSSIRKGVKRTNWSVNLLTTLPTLPHNNEAAECIHFPLPLPSSLPTTRLKEAVIREKKVKAQGPV